MQEIELWFVGVPGSCRGSPSSLLAAGLIEPHAGRP
jgi:hypothetical protein